MEKSTLKTMKFGKEKLKNIWFFYKKQIIAGALILIIGVFLFVQCAARRNDDLLIYWAGPVYFSSEAENKVGEAFEAVIPGEYAKSVGLVTTVIGDNIHVGATEEEKQQYAINYTKKQETLNDFKTRMRLPDTVICILSPACFEEAKSDTGTLRDLRELFPAHPDALTGGGYALLLSQLPFYKSNSILSNFPEDSLLCLKSSSILRSDSDYERQVEAFKSIVLFAFRE